MSWVQVIGLRGTSGHGSLREWGVAYRELPLAEGGDIDWAALASAITPSEFAAVQSCTAVKCKHSLFNHEEIVGLLTGSMHCCEQRRRWRRFRGPAAMR